eukprot:TRINITY_DN25065_c0_g3_i1.p1 TRINITY_DN25065_c0_g3~~TRINITY_DN25065_c0_g3_i1.p1  ORF type:complete len:480 (+),score=62.17 TRINITY_DN25065_c0_g3_i1:164-1603(+)
MAPTMGLAAKWVPADFTESSQIGGIFTIATHVIMVIVFFCELGSFLSPQTSTSIGLDRHTGQNLQINFDIEMYDIECKNLQVVAVSHSNDEPLSISSQDFWLRSLDSSGRTFGMATKMSEDDSRNAEAVVHNRQMASVIASDGKKELDSDWASSHDGFKHNSFDHVIQGHDFVMINFFAGWCSHCQKFSPTWNEIALAVNGDESGNKPMEFSDRDGQKRQVRLLKINCVDFKQICNAKGVDAYPMLRLYKADGSFSIFEGKRNKDEIIRWIERTVKMKSYGWATDHEAFERGCSAKGHIQVPRVPGHLEFMAGAGEQNLNPSMTNVSHLIKHLSFSNPDTGPYTQRGLAHLPQKIRDFVSPLDGKAYVTKNFHEVWIHDVKVVSTVSRKGIATYQFSHQHRLSKSELDAVPQMQIHFDVEPFSMYVTSDGKRWYDFITSMMAALGGIYAMMRLLSNTSLGIQKMIRPRSGRSHDFNVIG